MKGVGGGLAKRLTVAVDAMGGDDAPRTVIDGAAIAAKKIPDLSFTFFGAADRVSPLIEAHPVLGGRHQLVDCKYAVPMDMQPSLALRRGRDSSMRLAIDEVQSGGADFCISAGNTGALMVMSVVALRTLQDIDRPALCAFFPTSTGRKVYMLDLGANIECGLENYVEFAVMGSLYCSILEDKEKPTVGLLNIGVEVGKGKAEISMASRTLGQLDEYLNYTGYIEPDQVLHDHPDVVVTDGFSGNIALKTMEGSVDFLRKELANTLRSGFMSRLGGAFSRKALNIFKEKFNPREYNGAALLGLNGIVIKSHGGTDKFGYAKAVDLGAKVARSKYVRRLDERLGPILARLDSVSYGASDPRKG